MSAAHAIRPVQPSSLHNLSDADLADEHRGQSFAKRRAVERLAAIEAELERRGRTEARGTLSLTSRKTGSPLLDISRLRDEQPALCAAYAKPNHYWSSRTLTAEERSSSAIARNSEIAS